MITVFAFFLLIGLTYRLSRLVIADTITEWPRAQVMSRLSPESKLRTLLSCFWCVSFWLGLFVYGAWLWLPALTLDVAVPFTVSTVVGLVARNADY